MKTVFTKEELRKAIENKQFPIVCKGLIASQLRKKEKVSNAAKAGGLILMTGSLLSIPFSGGASAIGIGAGAAAMGLTIGTVTISTAELAILIGGGVAITAILKGRSIELRPDGTVIVN